MTLDEKKILQCFEKTFLCYIIEDADALALKARINDLEAELAQSRNKMTLGYTNPTDGSFVSMSSVQLRNTMRTADNEDLRLACFNAMRGIGPFVAEKFCEIVKLRNVFARSLGYEDFYDMKVFISCAYLHVIKRFSF